jgi:uncharacterized protein with FMN-binding domain
MRRAWIVAGATVVGLVGVLTFHTAPARLDLGGLSGPSATNPASQAGGTSPAPTTTASPPPGRTHATTPTNETPISAAPPASTRTATGALVNYSWGVLSVSVTETGTTIDKVGIASLDDGGNPRSQSIDQQSVPILEQEAVHAQSANIQGVSGASYTSSGFQQSLQSALTKLSSR